MSELATLIALSFLIIFPLLTDGKNLLVKNNVIQFNETFEGGNETELVNTARLHFNLNVSTVTKGRPFHAICNIDRWYGASKKDYVVNFYRTNMDFSNKELVGVHEVFAPNQLFPNGRHLFTRAPLSDVVITSGHYFTFPTFDLVGSPKSVSVDKVYWCELTDRSNSPPVTYISNIWDKNPALELTVTKLSDGPDRYLARCWVRHFYPNPVRSAYTVQFNFQHSSTSYNYGSFIRKSGGPIELSLGTTYYQKSVGHGKYFDVPVFDLVFEVLNYNYNGLKNYCRLFDDSDDWDSWMYVTSNVYNLLDN